MSDGATEVVRQAMPMCAALGITASRLGPDRVALHLEWSPTLLTSGGALHGGAVMALTDAGSTSATGAGSAGPPGRTLRTAP